MRIYTRGTAALLSGHSRGFLHLSFVWLLARLDKIERSRTARVNQRLCRALYNDLYGFPVLLPCGPRVVSATRARLSCSNRLVLGARSLWLLSRTKRERERERERQGSKERRRGQRVNRETETEEKERESRGRRKRTRDRERKKIVAGRFVRRAQKMPLNP